MGKLSDSAIIVIVIICCLAFISLVAALTRQLYPPSRMESQFEPSREQELYMRSVRMRTRGDFRQESLVGKDLESNCECFVFRLGDVGSV